MFHYALSRFPKRVQPAAWSSAQRIHDAFPAEHSGGARVQPAADGHHRRTQRNLYRAHGWQESKHNLLLGLNIGICCAPINLDEEGHEARSCWSSRQASGHLRYRHPSWLAVSCETMDSDTHALVKVMVVGRADLEGDASTGRARARRQKAEKQHT